MRQKQLYKLIARHVGFAVALMAVVACSSSEDVPIEYSEESETVRVVAEVAQQLYSRATEGPVETGTYYLSYPPSSSDASSTSDPYNVASVTFGDDETNPTIGFVHVSENLPLKWNDVREQGALYLDNVSTDFPLLDDSDPTIIVFDDNNNPYKAGLYDEENGTNDLLWDSKAPQHNAKTVYFNLNHNMSRIKVQVTVERLEQSNEDLDLKGATVTLSHINQTPTRYNRRSGVLELPQVIMEEEGKKIDDIYTTLTLVEDIEGGELSWAEKPNDDDINDRTKPLVYTTRDFVLPPQDLLEDFDRPRLTVQLANKDGEKGKVYSGILPHAMDIENEINTSDPYPATLSFLKGHILTIRTVITEEPPELAFMPVQVVQWVDKGVFSIEAHQSGIYTADEFESLIKYYGANREYQLPRYGRLVTDNGVEKWQFDFFSSVRLDREKIANRMQINNGRKDFYFNFNNYPIYIIEQEGASTELSEQELYNIVTGKATSSTP